MERTGRDFFYGPQLTCRRSFVVTFRSWWRFADLLGIDRHDGVERKKKERRWRQAVARREEVAPPRVLCKYLLLLRMTLQGHGYSQCPPS